MSDFQDRLRQIRQDKDRESRANRDLRTAASLDHVTRMERRIAIREQIEHLIEGYIAKFSAEVPGFTRSKSFFEGMYQIEVHNDEYLVDESGTPRKFFSRITFLLDSNPDSEVISVKCKKTVRNRDLESSGSSVDLKSGSLDPLKQFLEEQFLEFAGTYFGGAAGSRVN